MDLYKKNRKKFYPNESPPEIEVVLTKNGGKILFHIRKNMTIVKEREKIINENKDKLIYKNILVIFLDTLSRVHFYRKFPKTISFLEQFSNFEPDPLKKK